MDISLIVELIKERLGIKTTVRDTYLTAIVEGAAKELEDEKGLMLDRANPYHFMFVVDYATWRYQNRDSDGAMPRHLQFRMHNLMIHVGSANLRVDKVLYVSELPSIPVVHIVYILSIDGSQQMYIDEVWTAVDFTDGYWRVSDDL